MRPASSPTTPTLPERWSTSENIAWRTPLPGLGWSSPIVAGGLVFLTTVVSDGEVEAPESGWYRFGERDAPGDVHHWLVYALDLQIRGGALADGRCTPACRPRRTT